MDANCTVHCCWAKWDELLDNLAKSLQKELFQLLSSFVFISLEDDIYLCVIPFVCMTADLQLTC